MALERKIINPWKWQDNWGYVQANEVSGEKRTLIISGQTAADARGVTQHPGNMRAQMNAALDNLEEVLKEGGMTLVNVMSMRYYTTDMAVFIESSDVLGKRLGPTGCRPTATLLEVTSLATPEAMVEFEAVAMD
jgi:enamine deaminase RidA (YjgF/YER057c/UK114 family)